MNDRYVRSFSNSRGDDLDTNQLSCIRLYVLAKSAGVTYDLAVLNPRAIVAVVTDLGSEAEETRDSTTTLLSATTFSRIMQLVQDTRTSPKAPSSPGRNALGGLCPGRHRDRHHPLELPED